MNCSLSDEELWSGIDRHAPEVAAHLADCPTCQDRAEQFRAGIEAVARVSAPFSPPSPSRIGSFTIRRRLGEGGMGVVYEGQQQTPKRAVAIKVLRGAEALDEFRVRLFQREAHTLGRLKHPSIAAIYEAGQTDEGRDFFAMELVHGVPLNEYVRDRRVPLRERLKLFRKICDAISYAHQRGVIHRDLKPTNIFVDPEGNPKILDFGLARITDPDAALTTLLTDVGRMMGTLPYMSPEAVRGNPDEIDVRSDVYSLGVILYELMTDQLPYQVHKAALHQAIRVICEEPPPRPSLANRLLRGDPDTIALKALEKEPERRYPSVAMLAEDVTRYLNNQPILARKGSHLYRLRKFVARHKLFLGFGVASVVLVSAARLWVDRLEAQRRTSTVMLIELKELERAITENKLAETLNDQGRYREAEPHYRYALATFRRLGRYERAGPTLLALGRLLIQREPPAVKDLEDAEVFFLDALKIFDMNPSGWIPQRRRALEGLCTVYAAGRDVWDDSQRLLAQVEAELEAMDAAPEPEALEPAPPAQ